MQNTTTATVVPIDSYLSNSSSIASKAMISRLTVNQYKPSIVDKDATTVVHQQYMAGDEAGSYRKFLIKKSAYEVISKIIGEARTYHNKQTLPWGENGERLLPAKNYVEYTQKMGILKESFIQAVDDLVVDYPNLITEAQTRLGSMYNADEYKSATDIETCFNFQVKIKPVATAEDFRVDVARDDLDKITADIQKQLKEDQAYAMKDLWSRLYGAVTKMNDRLTTTRIDSKTNEEKPATFHASIVENLAELSQLLPKLNISNDPDLDKMCIDIQDQLCSFPAKELRKNVKAKNETAKAAKALMERMNGYMEK